MALSDEILKFTIQWETGGRKDGGYTNDPTDPGGETKWGISKRAHPNEDIKNLTYERARDIYESEYWNPTGCDSFNDKLAASAFDSAVNVGVGRVKDWLKKAKDSETLLKAREDYYQSLIKRNGKLSKYLKGWMARVAALRKFIASLS